MVLGEGPIPCDWLILGEAPGATEAEVGRPFQGRSGSLLRESLLGCPNAFITNAYKERPPGNRNPTTAELAAHRIYLEGEFETVRPSCVLTLGSVPLHVMVPEAPRITLARGTWFDSEEWGVQVFATYHPAYVLRVQKERGTFHSDVRNFFCA